MSAQRDLLGDNGGAQGPMVDVMFTPQGRCSGFSSGEEVIEVKEDMGDIKDGIGGETRK